MPVPLAELAHKQTVDIDGLVHVRGIRGVALLP